MEKAGQVRMFDKIPRTWHISRWGVRKYKSRSSSIQSESAQTIHHSILSVLQPQINEKENPYAPSLPADFDWYLNWLCFQISRLPEAEASLLANDSDSGTTSLGETSRFHKIFLAINQIARSQDNLSIDEIVEKLIEEDSLTSDSGSSDVSIAQRRLVFAMLGWQSMLFLPAVDATKSSNLNIYRIPGQPNSGLVFDNWSVSIDLTDRPLAFC